MSTSQCDRTVRTTIQGNHIARVVHLDRDGEYWRRYVIIPRELAIKHVRKERAKGHPREWRDPIFALPEGSLVDPHYGAPGQSFAHAPYRIRTSRRWVVFTQTGGLDI